MRDHQEDFERLGAGVAAIGLGDRAYASAFRAEAGIHFPLLVDEKRAAFKAAGLRRAGLLDVFNPLNRAARTRARESGFRQHRLGKDPFQLGGTFVFGPGNRDLFVHVSKTFGDNADLSTLLPSYN